MPKLKEWIDANDTGAQMIPFSGAFEAKVAEMEADARRAFLEENKVPISLSLSLSLSLTVSEVHLFGDDGSVLVCL